MNTVLIGFLSVSISAVCMAGIVLILEKLLKNHLSFRFRYGLWLVIILRLLIPVSPVSGLMGTLFTAETWKGSRSRSSLSRKLIGRNGVSLLKLYSRRLTMSRCQTCHQRQNPFQPKLPGIFRRLPGLTI